MSVTGTPAFISPEQVADWFNISFTPRRRYNTKTDMFSFGCLVARAISGEYPFDRLTMRLKQKKGISNRVDLIRHFTISTSVAQKVAAVHPVFAKLVNWCMQLDPEARPSPAQARELLKTL